MGKKEFALIMLILLAIISGCESSERAKRKYGSAEENLSEENYDKAIRRYREFIREFPSNELAPKAYLKIGDIYNFYYGRKTGGLDNYEKAIDSYEDLIERYPEKFESYQAKVKIAKIYEDIFQNCDQAAAQYKELLADDRLMRWEKTPGRWQYQIGECFFLQKRYTEAITEYSKLLEEFPGSEFAPKSQFQIADAYYLQKDYPSAIREYEKLRGKYPDSQLAVEASFWIGVSYEMLGEDNQALKIYRKILDDYPNKEVLQSRINNLAKK